MNTAEAHALIERMRAHYPFWSRQLSATAHANLAEDWAVIMSDLSADVVRAALAVLLGGEREFPPSAGVVNTKARALLATASGVEELGAGRAWARVCAAVIGDGLAVVRGPLWDDLTPAEAEAAEAFGLRRIRMRLEEDAGTDFAQFRDIYAVTVVRHNERRNTSPAVAQLIAGVTRHLRIDSPRPAAQLPAAPAVEVIGIDDAARGRAIDEWRRLREAQEVTR